MALRRSRSTWPTWLGFCGTFTVRWWAIVHESLASHASSDFWRKTRGLERQQMGTDSDVFFCQFGQCVWCLWNTAHDISWPLKLGPGRSLEYQLPCTPLYTNVGLWPSSEVWIWYGFTKTYVYYLCLSYVLEIFEHIQRSCSLQRLFCSTMPWQCPQYRMTRCFQQPTANRCLGHASTRIQDHHDANQRVATNKESLDLRSAVLILIYFDCPFVSF